MIRTWTTLSAFVAGTALGLVAPGCAEVADRGQNSVSGSILNPCDDELVQLAREEHLTYTIVDDGAGGYDVSSHAVVTASGQGPSGNAYVGFGEGDSTFKVKPPYPSMARFSDTVSIVGQGLAPKLLLTFSWLATVNANGELTADLYDVIPECRG
jgi:hypothetical protein